MAEKRAVRTEAAPAPFQGAPYSQAVVAGGFVFVSGQVGMPPAETQVVGDTVEAGCLVEIDAVALAD